MISAVCDPPQLHKTDKPLDEDPLGDCYYEEIYGVDRPRAGVIYPA